MSRLIEFGNKGEDDAAAWLAANGYTILQRNFRHLGKELDIIARKDNIYHFIEVKASRSSSYGPPESRVSPAKIRRIMATAAAWLHDQRLHQARRQFDVLAITMLPGADPEFFFISDIYP